MTDETTEIRFEFRFECAIEINGGATARLVEQVIFAFIDVESRSVSIYEYLWGVWEYILFKYGFLYWYTFIINLLETITPN